jgi:hypothetical protein
VSLVRTDCAAGMIEGVQVINFFRIVAALLAAFSMTVSVAQELGSERASLIGERPNSDGPPTQIFIGMYLLDIDNVNDVSQRFSVDLFVEVDWHDPRLALPEADRNGEYRAVAMDEIWMPSVLVVNDRGLEAQLPRIANVDDLGNVDYRQRVTGELAVDMELREFPFDTQRLPIEIITYKHSPDEVLFSLDASISGNDGSFSAEGWEFSILDPEINELLIPGARHSRPQLTYLIKAERNTRYFMWTMFMPMGLITLMAWAAFWLQPDLVPARLGISTGSIFSLIAFGFSIRLSLPPVSYLTRADAFVIGATLLVFLALAITVIGSRMASAGRMELALRINASARVFYLVLMVVIASAAMTL